jgi:transcriptional regulator with XRE-family HTH domain
MMTFGQFICAQRRERGLPQDAFAKLAGLHRTHISLIERGKRDPGLETIVQLARALDMKPADLLDDYAQQANVL